MRVSLINGVSTGLTAMAAQFARAAGSARALKGELSAIKMQMLVGGAMAATGAFGLAMVGKTVGPAREYAHQLTQMNAAGMQHLEIVRATNAAWAATRNVPTSSATENLAAIRELRMVFGDTQHAIDNMPIVQRLQAILNNTKGTEGRGHDEAYTTAKALEMKGAVRTPSEFAASADLMTRAIIASGGKVGAGDFLSTFKYGRAATSAWNDHFTYSILPTLIQEMKTAGGTGGAGGPGNALMSAYSAVVGGAVAQKSLKVWKALGLLDESKIVWTKAGEAKGLQPGGVRGGELFQADPYAWTRQMLAPAMAKAGYTSEAQQRQALQYLFPNRTAGFVMTQMMTQGWKFDRDQKLIGQAQGLSAYNTLLKTDPYMAQMALQKQWNSLMAILGFQIMPAVIGATLKFMGMISGLATLAKEHPTLTKVAVSGFAAFSGLLLVGGLITMTAGAFRALGLALTFAGPIMRVVPLIGRLLPLLGGPLGIVARGFGMLLPVIAGISAPVWLAIGAGTALVAVIWNIWKGWDANKSVFDNILSGIGRFFSGLWNLVAGLLSKIPGLGGLDPNKKTKPGAPGVIAHGDSAFGKAMHEQMTGHERGLWGALGHSLGGVRWFGKELKPGDPGYIAPKRQGSAFVPDGSGKPTKLTISIPINLDGRQITHVVSEHQAREASGVNASWAYDPEATLGSPGAAYV